MSVWSNNATFILSVKGNCSLSTEVNSLVASSAMSAQTYSVGAICTTINVTEFTESSAYCTLNDIVYSMAVTPAKPN
jgi:hypothetical protein